MERSYLKPQEAREIEARARARQLRIRVTVVAEAESYVSSSRSRPGVMYTIQRTPAGWACSCMGYRTSGACKHLGQVERRSEREGWDFGSVAPLHRVERYLPLAMPARRDGRGAAVVAAGANVVPLRQVFESLPLTELSHERTVERQSA
jgi:hypothetical protein